jgi:fibronectin-binding autotransporter adhesin
MNSNTLRLTTLSLILSPAAYAATINFAAPQDCTADTDVLSTGLLRYAYTWNNTARTVNGVNFVVAGTSATTPNGGNVSLSGFNTVNQTAFTSTAAPFTNLSAAYKGMLLGSVFTTGNTAATATLNNLTPGASYIVQIWCSDPRAATATRATTVTSGMNTTPLDYNVGNVGGGVGQSVVGSFIADASTQSFTVSGGASNQINALQLRAEVGKWSGTASGIWDDASLSFSGSSFNGVKAALVVEFGDRDGSGNPVTRTDVTIQAGGVTGATPLFSNNTIDYTLNSADAVGFNGAFGITKSGTAGLTLAGANTHTVDTTLSGGFLKLAHANAIAASSLNFTGGTLSFETLTATAFGGLKGNQALRLENAAPLPAPVTLTVGGNNQTTTFSGTLNGPGTLIKTGTGTLTLTGAANHTGGTLVNAGTLIAAPAVHQNSPITVSGGTLSYQNNTALTASLPAYTQSSGNLLLDLTTDAADQITVAGDLSLTGATVTLNPISAPQLNVPYTLFTYSGTLTGTPVISIPSRLTYTLDRGTGADSQIKITFTSAPAELVWKGSVDDQWVNDPRLNWLNSAAADRFHPVDAVRFDDTAVLYQVLIPTGTDVVPGPITVENVNNPYIISGGRITGAASLTKKGAGTLALASANAHTGGTIVSQGTLNANAVASLGTGPLTVDGTINFTIGGGVYTGLNNSLSGGGIVNVTLGTGTATNTFSGNNNNFTGTLNVGVGAAAGAGKIQPNTALAPSVVINVLTNGTVYCSTAITHSASLILNGGDMGETLGQIRLENATWAGPITIAADPSPATDATIGTNTGTGTFSGLIGETGGSRALIKGGVGTSVLSGNNTFSGPVTINAGRLHAGSNQALGTGTSVTVKTATALQLDDGVTITGKTLSLAGFGNGTTNFNGALQAGFGTATWAGPVILNDTTANTPRLGAVNGGTLIVSGYIQNGTGTNLFISAAAGGTGTVILAGQNAYTGTTAITRGILALGVTNSLPVATTLDVDNALGVADIATFDLRGFNQTIGGLTDTATTSVNGIVTNSDNSATSTLTINNTAAFTYDGILSGNLHLVKTGTGTQTLTGLHSYTGNTTVQAGILTLSTGNLPDGGDVFLLPTGTLNLTHTVTDTVDTLEIAGVLQPAGIWGSETSTAPNKTSRITGPGLLSVQNGPTADAFSTWIDNFASLTNPADKTKTADPDKDGLGNFGEFAFGGDPTSAASNGEYRSSAIDTNGDTISEAILTIAVREGAVFAGAPEPTADKDGIRYSIQGALNTASFGLAGAPAVAPLGVYVPPVGGAEAPGGYAWQRFRLSGSEGLPGRGFLRAKASPIP